MTSPCLRCRTRCFGSTISYVRSSACGGASGRTSWVDILNNIKAVVETGNVPLKTRLMLGMMSAFMFMAPKDTLRQNISELNEKK